MTIEDDDSATVTIAGTDIEAAEPGTDKGLVTITRAPGSNKPLTVKYSVSGTATNGTDCLKLSGSVTIPANTTATTITVSPKDDTTFEGSETLIITLIAGTGYTVGTPSSVTLTIADNDLPTVSISATDSAASEAALNPGQLTITRTGRPLSALTVLYTVAGTAASGTDYVALSGTVTIAAGAASATIAVTPANDAIPEGNETVVATLSANAAYNLGTRRSATVTISDDD